MDILKIIFGVLLIAVLPSFWVIVGGASVASLGGFPGILLLIVWLLLLFAGVKMILTGLK